MPMIRELTEKAIEVIAISIFCTGLLVAAFTGFLLLRF